MSNERIRSALIEAQLSAADLAAKLRVDVKTVERWVSKGRTPHRRTAEQAAAVLKKDPESLWPDLGRGRRRGNQAEDLVALYPTRNDVPAELWLQLLEDASTAVDILVYAGSFLAEANPRWIATIAGRAAEGARIRLAFGDPAGPAVALRGKEEQVGDGMSARVRNTLIYYKPLVGHDGVAVGLHGATLYNSIFRFDDHMLVNAHIYGGAAFHSPVLHLRRTEASVMFDNYAAGFERVWNVSRIIADLNGII